MLSQAAQLSKINSTCSFGCRPANMTSTISGMKQKKYLYDEISIILPTYNERDSIIPLIHRIQAVMGNFTEIIVVDDNSPDGTARLIARMFSKNSLIRVIERHQEHGLASAIARGIHEARGSILVWMDCDLSMPPETIPQLVSMVAEKSYDAAVGSRYCEGGNDRRSDSHKPLLILHTFLSRIITKFSSLMLGGSFRDWTSGFIAIRKSAVCDYGIKGDYGEYFIALIHSLLIKGYRVAEVPYDLTCRKYGYSKTAQSVWGFFKRGFKYVSMVLFLKWS